MGWRGGVSGRKEGRERRTRATSEEEERGFYLVFRPQDKIRRTKKRLHQDASFPAHNAHHHFASNRHHLSRIHPHLIPSHLKILLPYHPTHSFHLSRPHLSHTLIPYSSDILPQHHTCPPFHPTTHPCSSLSLPFELGPKEDYTGRDGTKGGDMGRLSRKEQGRVEDQIGPGWGE